MFPVQINISLHSYSVKTGGFSSPTLVVFGFNLPPHRYLNILLSILQKMELRGTECVNGRYSVKFTAVLMVLFHFSEYGAPS